MLLPGVHNCKSLIPGARFVGRIQGVVHIFQSGVVDGEDEAETPPPKKKEQGDNQPTSSDETTAPTTRCR